MAYISMKGIHKKFGDNHVLQDVSMEIEKGSFVTLLGSSGCGKSTLLRCLAGLENVSDGKIFMDGQDITHVSARHRGIGMIFQQYSLFPNLTVAQNVAFGLTMQKKHKEDILRKVNEILDIVSLSEKRDQYPSRLSGGQQQRVALARAIVTEPKVLLLDEPLSAIDAKLRRSLQIEIRRIHEKFKMTSIFVTHDQSEAMVMSDEIKLMEAGQIIQSGPPSELYANPRNRFVASFIGSYNIFSAEQFKQVFGKPPNSKDVAIRPEMICVSQNGPPSIEADAYCAQGKVVASISYGNILRYSIHCNGVELNSDVIFEAGAAVSSGESIWLVVRRSDVIELQD